MSQNVTEREAGPCVKPAQADGKLSIPVKLGCSEERVFELEPGSRVTRIIEIIATERGCGAEELVLYREGVYEPLTSSIVVDANYPHSRYHHVHHPGEVAVTVYYQDARRQRLSKRFETVKDVLIWAIEAFNVDTSMATEFELAHHGQKEELPGHEHIGHLVGKNCEIEFDLVRGVIANGSRS